LLVWDKDSYTKRVLALLPCTCVLQANLIHLYKTSLLLPDQLPIVTSVVLRFLYYLFSIEHIKHFQILGFLPVPIPPVCVLSVWLMANNITAFVLDRKSTYEGEHTIFAFLSLANFA
jgi:hypothetical protein